MERYFEVSAVVDVGCGDTKESVYLTCRKFRQVRKEGTCEVSREMECKRALDTASS